MAWCPVCRYEFVDGVKECPKCHVALVASLSDAESDMKDQTSLEDLTEENAAEDIEYRAEIDPEREDRITPSEEERIRQSGRPHPVSHVQKIYQSKAQKAEDAKSSGISQVLVGAIVLVFVLLWAFDLLPIRMNIERRFITCGILGAFSLFWLILGVFSLRSFKRLAVFAQEEDRRTDEILKWAKTLEPEEIDAPMADLGLAEEEKYFGRMEIIGQLMKDRFVNLDPDYADDVCEKIYQQLYEKAE